MLRRRLRAGVRSTPRGSAKRCGETRDHKRPADMCPSVLNDIVHEVFTGHPAPSCLVADPSAPRSPLACCSSHFSRSTTPTGGKSAGQTPSRPNWPPAPSPCAATSGSTRTCAAFPSWPIACRLAKDLQGHYRSTYSPVGSFFGAVTATGLRLVGRGPRCAPRAEPHRQAHGLHAHGSLQGPWCSSP